MSDSYRRKGGYESNPTPLAQLPIVPAGPAPGVAPLPTTVCLLGSRLLPDPDHSQHAHYVVDGSWVQDTADCYQHEETA